MSDTSKNAVTLQLEGRVVDHWVEVLSTSCDQVLAEQRHLTLDLAGVSFIDKEGIALFRRLKSRDVKILNCSGFVTLLLKSENSH